MQSLYCCEWDAERKWNRLTTDEVLESTRLEECDQEEGVVCHRPILEIQDGSEQTMYQAYKGQLRLSVYINCGLITVHVIQARHLSSSRQAVCNAYVKLSLVPDQSKRSRCRTDNVERSNHPLWDEKFSIALLDQDYGSRLVLSVWNRTHDGRHSECLGSMSFGIAGLMHREKEIGGWHYLLSEHVGKNKRLAVDSCALVHTASSTGSSLSGGVRRPAIRAPSMQELKKMRRVQLLLAGGMNGYGLSVTAGRPTVVSRVTPGSAADTAGVKAGDCIVQIQGEKVHRLSSQTVARIIRHYPNYIPLTVCRRWSEQDYSVSHHHHHNQEHYHSAQPSSCYQNAFYNADYDEDSSSDEEDIDNSE